MYFTKNAATKYITTPPYPPPPKKKKKGEKTNKPKKVLRYMPFLIQDKFSEIRNIYELESFLLS